MYDASSKAMRNFICITRQENSGQSFYCVSSGFLRPRKNENETSCVKIRLTANNQKIKMIKDTLIQ